MNVSNETLKRLVADACTHPPRTAERRQCIQEIYRLVMLSGKLWMDHAPYYGDALQETWEYCCQHLDDYDPSLSAVTTWINQRLKWTLKKWSDRQNRDQNRTLQPTPIKEGEVADPVERLRSPTAIDRAQYIWRETLNWVQTDPEGVLTSTCFRKRIEINAQVLFLKRFPSETPWQDIARDFNLSAAEAKDLPKFYNRKCLPLLRTFGITQGFL